MMEFDIDIATVSFMECYEDNLNLGAYNRGYEHLHKFFMLLGRVFGFIASDVRSKIDILNECCVGNRKEYYQHVELMMLHEIEVNKETTAALKGSRTLLRLHRALKFTMLFLERLIQLNDNDSVGNLASTAYDESLSNFHPWVIRQPAKLAMYTLPSKKELFQIIFPDMAIDIFQLKGKILSFVESMKPVYRSCEDLYTKYDLHGLP